MIVTSGCQSNRPSSPPARPEKPRVVAANYPLAWFAERIGGDTIDVELPVPPDVAPADWKPTRGETLRIQAADLILLNNEHHAKWTNRVTLPESRTVTTTRELTDRFLQIPNAVTHTHGPEGEHSHDVPVAETWLDPGLAIEQARTVKKELAQRWPDHAARFETNFAGLERDLQSLDDQIQRAFEAKSAIWCASHAGFRYVARRVSLPITIFPATKTQGIVEPDWAKIDELRHKSQPVVMLWSTVPNGETSTRLKASGVQVVVFNFGEHAPQTGDYLTLMQENLKRLTSR